MYDIKSLENEWEEYNKNKKRSLYFFIALIVTLIAVVSFFLNGKNIIFSKISSPFVTNQDNSTKGKYDAILMHKEFNDLQMNVVEASGEIKPIPNLDIEENTKDMPVLPIVNNIPVLDNEKFEKSKIQKNIDKDKYEKPIIHIVTTDIAHKKIDLNIVESSSISAYEDVEKRFRQTFDTDDSLFLAKSYFRKGQYSQAEFWALETNKINPNIEESWLIFVKSKAKLGQKNEAIRILTSYAKKSNSSRAWNLLLKLKQ